MAIDATNYKNSAGEISLTNDVDINELLMCAVNEGNLEAAKLFLEGGANKTINDYDNIALKTAILSENLAMVQLLLDNGADANRTDPHYEILKGTTPLMIAAIKGHYEITKLLLENGAAETINLLSTIFGIPALVFSIRHHRNADVINLLLDNGADVEMANADGSLPLKESIYHENNEVTRLLLNKKVSLYNLENIFKEIHFYSSTGILYKPFHALDFDIKISMVDKYLDLLSECAKQDLAKIHATKTDEEALYLKTKDLKYREKLLSKVIIKINNDIPDTEKEKKSEIKEFAFEFNLFFDALKYKYDVLSTHSPEWIISMTGEDSISRLRDPEADTDLQDYLIKAYGLEEGIYSTTVRVDYNHLAYNEKYLVGEDSDSPGNFSGIYNQLYASCSIQ